LKTFLLLETEMNHQQNKYNISRHLETLLNYHVKHKSIKCCSYTHHSLMTKLLTSPFF